METLTPSISLQDLLVLVEARVQEANKWLGSAEAATDQEVWVDFEQTTVDKRKPSGGNNLGPVWRLKDSTLTHADLWCPALY